LLQKWVIDMTKQLFEVQIPFSGFYNSLHDSAIDDDFNQIMSDSDTGNTRAPDRLYSLAFGAVSWNEVHLKYAQKYAKLFCDEFDLEGSFAAFDSPKYYNFETDRIFIQIDRATLAKVLRQTDKADFAQVCKDRFTSRDGFSSFYNPDWKTWGKLSVWDCNQLGALLQAYCDGKALNGSFDGMAEYYLASDMSGNGWLPNWIWEAGGADFKRAVKIWDYLQVRAGRVE
jgi:hypothetical protein